MRFKQPHKSTVLAIVLFCLVVTLVWRPLLAPGIMYTHDGENHLARFANYYLAARQGQIPPRFAPNLFNHYGYPVFNFNYPLANLLSLPFSIGQISYEVTFKFLIVLSLVSGSAGVYFWLRQLSCQKLTVWLALVGYVTTPYILSAVLFRGNIGEIMVYCLLPWLFWLVEWVQHRSRRDALLVGIPILSALLLAHNVTSLLAVGLVGVYACVAWGKKAKTWQTGAWILLASIGLTLWFWLPAIMESQQTVVLAAGIQHEYQQHFVTLHQLLFSPLSFGYSVAGPVDTLSLSLGWLSVMTLYGGALIGSIWLFCHRKIHRHVLSAHRQVIVLYVITLLLLFLQTMPAQSVWDALGFMRIIQFPWRLTLCIPILLLPVFAQLFQQPSKVLKVLLLSGLLIQLIIALRLPPIGRIHHTNEEYEAAYYSTSTQNENLPKRFTYEYFAQEDWRPTVKIMAGTGTIEAITRWNGSDHRYQVQATTPITVVEPTMYFSGWQTTLKNLDQPNHKNRVQYVDSADIGGRIAYNLPAGRYQIESRFTQNTPPRRVGNVLFVVTLLAYGWIFWQFLIDRRQKKHTNQSYDT